MNVLRPGEADADACGYVWTGREPFDAFREKSAAALVAVRRALARHRPLAGAEAEFLTLYARVAAADAAAFGAAFGAPQGHAWTAAAFRLCAAVLSGRAPEAAASLARHLEGFKALALGQHWIAGRDLAFSAPLAITPPFALPGTRWVLFGPPAAIPGLQGGRLVVEAGGSTQCLAPGDARGPFALRASPQVELDGATIVVSPFPIAAAQRDLGGAAQAVSAGLDYHAAQLDHVRRTLALVARHAPATWSQFREVVGVIALQPPGASSYLAASTADAPGAFVASAVDCAHELADFFVHEFHHTRMFVLEALAPVLALQPEADPAIHYSPWRDDRRPLRGLLHALYVHVPVAWYWLDVHAAADAGPQVAALAADRAVRSALQFDVALSILERHGRFSSAGRRVFDEIVRAVREVQAAVRSAGLSPGLAASEAASGAGHTLARTPGGMVPTVAESLREHARRFDPSGEAAALLASA